MKLAGCFPLIGALCLFLSGRTLETSPACSSFRTGLFVSYPDGRGSRNFVLIERRDSLQTETDFRGTWHKYIIRWTDDCSYILDYRSRAISCPIRFTAFAGNFH